MKFDSPKHMIGWYLARTHKGGRLRQQHQGPRVQQGHIDNEATAMILAQALPRFAGSPERLARWLRWGDVTDGAVVLNGHDYDRLSALRAWAEAHGYLSPRPTLPPMERHAWTDLSETREKHRHRLSTKLQERGVSSVLFGRPPPPTSSKP